MAKAWGNAFGNAWGVSWGSAAPVVTVVGPAGGGGGIPRAYSLHVPQLLIPVPRPPSAEPAPRPDDDDEAILIHLLH